MPMLGCVTNRGRISISDRPDKDHLSLMVQEYPTGPMLTRRVSRGGATEILLRLAIKDIEAHPNSGWD